MLMRMTREILPTTVPDEDNSSPNVLIRTGGTSKTVLYAPAKNSLSRTFSRQCIPGMSTDSRRHYVPHFILLQITCCTALLSCSLFPAFYPLALPHLALLLFTNTRHRHERSVLSCLLSEYKRPIILISVIHGYIRK